MSKVTPQQVAAYLETVARRKDWVSYSTLAAHFGLTPMDGAWSAHPLCSLFDVLDREDALAKRPFRTVVVWKKEDKMPGQGFFDALAQLKGIKALNDTKRLEVFANELSATHNYKWP